MDNNEFKVKRSILVEQLMYYESMIEKFTKLKQIASDRLARNEDSLTASESDGEEEEGSIMDVSDGEGEEEEESIVDVSDGEEEVSGDSKLPIEMNNQFIITPINKVPTSRSRICYVEQMERYEEGKTLMWDDTKYNSTKKAGGMFAFVQNGVKAQICQIVNIYPPKSRLSSWSANIGQSDRNVLELTDILVELTWDEWISNGGHTNVMGTTNVNKNKNMMLDYIKSRID
jgi:hypothetical protein